MKPHGQHQSHPMIAQLASAIEQLPPALLLRRILNTASRLVPQCQSAFLLVRERDALTTFQGDVTGAGVGAFQQMMGAKFARACISLAQAPALCHALAQQQDVSIVPCDLPDILNNLITPQQAQALADGYGCRRLLFTPLVRPQATLGFLVLLLATPELSPEAREDAASLRSLVALTLEMHQLHEQRASQERQMAAMHAVSLRVSRSLDLEEIMQQAVVEVVNVLEVDAAGISVIEPESGDLVIRAQQGLHKFAQTPVRIPQGKGVAWDTLQKKTLRVVESWANEPGLALPEFLEEEVNTTALVPMCSGGESVGVLSAMSRSSRYFTEGELNLLTSIADQVAVALRNARLHAETRRQAYERAFLFNLAAAVAPMQDVTHIAHEALHYTLAFLSWPLGAFLLEDESSGALVPQAHQGEAALVEALIGQLRASLSQLDPAQAVVVSYPEDALRTVIQIPLQSRRRTWGWLLLGTPEMVDVPGYAREVLGTVSSHLGVAIENARLYHEMTEREQSTRALYQITRAMTGHDLPVMLEQTLNELHQGIRYEIAGVLLTTQPPLEFLRLRLAVPPERLDVIEGHFLTALGTAQRAPSAFTEQQRVIIQSGEDGELADDQLLSYLEAPIMRDDEPLGAILLVRRRPFHVREQRLLFILAYQLSKVLVTIQLFHQARQQATQLQEINALLELQKATQIEMFDDIAHELRNPVTFMQSYPELFLAGALGDLNAEQRDALEVLQQQAHLLARLVHDLGSMKVIDRQSLRYRQIDLGDLLRKFVEATQLRARQNDQIVCAQLADDLPRIAVDPDRILQVVGNLMSNAIKFTPAGGTITLAAGREPEAVRISVTDTGPGIPEEERAMIFKRLYQGRLGRKYPGMGIGLALSQHIVETHGGAIGVRSREGEGSTFYFTLPLQKP